MKMKLFHVIATSLLGTAMALGTGFALASNQDVRRANATDPDESFVPSGTSSISTSSTPWRSSLNPNNYESDRGLQWSSGNSPKISYLTSGTYEKVVVTASTNGGSSSLEVSVGGSALGASQTIGSGTSYKNTEYTFDGNVLTGTIEIDITNTATKSVWVKRIDVYEQTATGPFTVTYDANGGTGTMVDAHSPYESGALVTVGYCSFTAPDGYEFDSFNTKADGSGTRYMGGEQFNIGKNTILYAIWTRTGGMDLATDLNEGDVVIMVNTTAQAALTDISTIGVATDYDDPGFPSEVYPLTICEGSSAGTLAFKTNDNKYISWSSGNSLATSESIDANSSWTVSFDGNDATVANSTDATRVIKYNAGSPRFAAYTGDLDLVQFYVKSAVPALPKMNIVDADGEAKSAFDIIYHVETTFKVKDKDGNYLSGLSWSSSDSSTVLASGESTQCSVVGNAIGSATLTATKTGYKDASVTINVSNGAVSTLTISGSMTKKAYTAGEAWDPAGFVVTAKYQSNVQEVVTDDVTWSYKVGGVDSTTAKVGDTVVVAYASYGEITEASLGQEVTVTAAPADPGTADNPYTVEQAIANTPASGTLSGKYVRGYIIGNPSIDLGYGNANFNIGDTADATTTFYIFRAFDIGNVKFTSTSKIKAGDIVVVYGDLKTYSSTKELASGYLISIESAPAEEPATTIPDIYTKHAGTEADVLGYYAGFLTGSGPIFMAGEYGIIIYNPSFETAGYVVGETKCRIQGSISIYHGLYQITNETVTESSAEIATPVTYTVTGNETQAYESRLTYVTGSLKSVAARKEGETKWEKDTTVIVTVNGHDIDCFAKAGAFTTDQGAEIETKIGQNITFKGFTSWFDAFQVRLNEVVETGGYSLEQFVSDFLSKTHGVCGDAWTEGSNHKTELQTNVWNVMNADDTYRAMSEEDQETLRTHVIVKDATDLDRALERYEFLVLKYELGDFLERGLSNGSNKISLINNTSYNVVMITLIVSAISIVSVAGAYFIIRRRKHQ